MSDLMTLDEIKTSWRGFGSEDMEDAVRMLLAKVKELEANEHVAEQALAEYGKQSDKITALEAENAGCKHDIDQYREIDQQHIKRHAILITELRDWKYGWASELELLPPRALDELTALLEKQDA